jgi:hypothetical protein
MARVVETLRNPARDEVIFISLFIARRAWAAVYGQGKE